MLPNVTHLISIDSYRDGGSLGISFDGEGKYWYELFLPIKREHKLDNQNRVVDSISVGYLDPVLKIYTPFESVSKITGIINTEYKETKQPISWEIANNLLKTMKDLVESFEMEGELSEFYDRDEGLSIYQEMLNATKIRGSIE
jgi:hypothetical protein